MYPFFKNEFFEAVFLTVVDDRLGLAVALAYSVATVAAVLVLAFAGELEPVTATIDGEVCRVWVDDCGNVCQSGYCALKGCPDRRQPMCLDGTPQG